MQAQMEHEQMQRHQMEEQQRQAMQQEEEEEDVQQPDDQYQHGEPGGALVQEARKLMQQDEEEEAPKEAEENAGPKIKMNRIGRKAKKGGDEKSGSKPGPSGAKEAKDPLKQFGDKIPSGGFSEQDIEFMKKAI